MKDGDWKKFCATLGVTAELYNMQKPSMAAMKLYFSVLGDYSLADFLKAVEMHLKQSPFFPKPADIVKQIHGTAEIRGLEAWHEVEKAMKKHGNYRSVRFPRPSIHWAIERLGGWESIFLKNTEKNQSFLIRDFCKIYERAEKVATWDNSPKYLMGLIERQNRQGSHWESLPGVVDVETGEIIKGIENKKPKSNIRQLPNVDIKKLTKGD